MPEFRLKHLLAQFSDVLVDELPPGTPPPRGHCFTHPRPYPSFLEHSLPFGQCRFPYSTTSVLTLCDSSAMATSGCYPDVQDVVTRSIGLGWHATGLLQAGFPPNRESS